MLYCAKIDIQMLFRNRHYWCVIPVMPNGCMTLVWCHGPLAEKSCDVPCAIFPDHSGECFFKKNLCADESESSWQLPQVASNSFCAVLQWSNIFILYAHKHCREFNKHFWSTYFVPYSMPSTLEGTEIGNAWSLFQEQRLEEVRLKWENAWQG